MVYIIVLPIVYGNTPIEYHAGDVTFNSNTNSEIEIAKILCQKLYLVGTYICDKQQYSKLYGRILRYM